MLYMSQLLQMSANNLGFVCRSLTLRLAVLKSEAYGTQQLNRFMRGLYEGDVFIPSATARCLCASLYSWLRAYCFLAHDSFEKGVAAYPMLPKLHAVHEIGHLMRHQATLSNFVVNPAVHSCSVDEDMVGRCACISRGVSPQKIPQRTLERYLCHIQILWARA